MPQTSRSRSFATEISGLPLIIKAGEQIILRFEGLVNECGEASSGVLRSAVTAGTKPRWRIRTIFPCALADLLLTPKSKARNTSSYGRPQTSKQKTGTLPNGDRPR